MATLVTHDVGSTAPVYSTLAGWDAAVPADIRSGTGTDEIWKAEVLEKITVTSQTTFGGTSTSATNYKWITAKSGQSWQELLSTSRIGGNISGAGITASFSGSAFINLTENYVVVENLAFTGTGSSAAMAITNAGTNCVFRNNYVRTRHNSAGYLATPSGANSVFINNFFEYGGTAAMRMVTVANAPTDPADAPSFINNTFLFTSTDVTNAAIPARGYVIESNSATGTRYVRFINNAFLGAGTLFLTTAGTLNFTSDSGYNLVSLPLGSTDYSDKFPTGAGGNLYSGNIDRTWSDSNNVLVNTTYAAGDMRAFATGELDAAGVRVTTPTHPYGSGGATQRAGTADLDGYGNARSPSAPWIGAWEDPYVGGSSAAAILAYRRMLME